MKKFWKVTAITLGSVIAVALIAVLVVIYLVFTPKRLTPIVNSVADDYITCEYELGEVELTFFSTFPEFGLRVNGLYIINPTEGAQSDTLLAAPQVVTRLDIKKFLSEQTLDVHELSIKDALANVFIGENGITNFDVFALSEDTTETDTSAFSLPFDQLNIDAVSLQFSNISFVSLQDSIDARLANTSLTAAAKGWEDINLELKSKAVTAVLGEVKYADEIALSLKSNHTGINLDSLRVTLRDAQLKINDFDVALKGEVAMPEDISLDINIKTGDWDIPTLLTLLPVSITSLLDGIDINAATLSLNADVKGVYNDSLMPLVDAHLNLTDAEVAYLEVFPYQLTDVSLNADAHIDFNDEINSTVTISSLHARTGKTTIDVTGEMSDVLDDVLCNISAALDVNLPEFKQYLDSDGINTDLKGRAKGTAKAKIRLSALSDMKLAKGVISGNLDLTDFHVTYDSILLDAPKMHLTFNIPNAKPSRKQVNWITATLTPSKLDAQMIGLVEANLGATTLTLQASDVLSNSNMLYADLSLKTETLNAELDSMGAALVQPQLTAAVDYDMKDSDKIPTVNATLNFADINAYYDDIKARLGKSELTATLSPTTKDRTQPKVHATLTTANLKANMGEDINVKTEKLSLTADAAYNPKKENIILQWNPKVKVDLQDGWAHLATLTEDVSIPQITFDYSNRVFNIQKSGIVIGNSDFSLAGQVRNIGKWLDGKGNLEGELAFTSDHTDVNELMDLISADSGTEETEAEAQAAITQEDKEANPFLVPKDMDITLTTNIREAVFFDQIARELGGKLYLKDGVMVLEEMGFICNAAKLQLTAIYKTPRRNHIYAGVDYHMIDINMQELVNMIPQIDTLMPMLRSFRGNGEFHLAAETYLNANYDPKWSTARGAVSITGRNLVLLDSETFGQIAKILLFNRKTENLVDSISVQATLFKKEIDIYPFCLTMDKYMAAVGGRHNLDMSFDYHISLLSPLYIGVDVLGTFDDLKIKPTKCKYAKDFRPIIRKDIETQNASLKTLINQSLKRNVKIE